MTTKQEARVNGYYWIEHRGQKQFVVKDADGAGNDEQSTFSTRRDAERYILALQKQGDERKW